MKPVVMQLLVTLHMGGAERLAASILEKGKKHFSGIIAGLYQEPGALAQYAASLGLPSVAIRADNSGKVGAILRIYRALRQHKVKLLHVQAGYMLHLAFPAAKMAGIPVVYTEHALHSLQRYRKNRLSVRLIAPWLQGIACVNDEVAHYFQKELGIAPKRIQVIANGVDADRFSPAVPPAPLPWNNDPGTRCFVFGTVARLTDAKDHPTLLRAFSIVSQRHPQTRLLLVGDGEERARTEALVQTLGLENTVHITGICLGIPERLTSMDVFLLSSKREGLPMALLEAMACGLPTISTAAGGIPKLNKDNEHVLLVPTENPEALAQAMEELLLHEQKRQTLAESGRAYVLATKTDQVMADAYYQMYLQGGLECGG